MSTRLASALEAVDRHRGGPRSVAPRRVGALAVLPVFFSLKDRRAVVGGGSDAAAWKAELLAASGADVAVFLGSQSPGAMMMELAVHGAAAGSVRLHERHWTGDDLVGSVLAVADCADDFEANRFACAAQSAGVPHNVIDKPARCGFQFGGIVNRSPVVVGISTDGAAPVLGQAVRRRIETVLPASLAVWGAAAAHIRQTVIARLRPGAVRRRFWEVFADLAFSSVRRPAESDLFDLVEDILQAPAARGRVTLVDAGPGEADLLTVRAIRALQAADVILFDDLVSDEVLELARREAQRVPIGRRHGRQSLGQEDVDELMSSLAGQGKNVVRLKSGALAATRDQFIGDVEKPVVAPVASTATLRSARPSAAGTLCGISPLVGSQLTVKPFTKGSRSSRKMVL